MFLVFGLRFLLVFRRGEKGMRRQVIKGVLITAFLCLMMGSASADQLRIIGNRSVPVAPLDAGTIKKIYLGKMKVWDNGMKVEFARLSEGPVTKTFLKTYVKKNLSSFKRYWKKNVFTGGGSAPVVFEKERDLVAYIERTKGAIGYVSSKAQTDQVKILLETPL